MKILTNMLLFLFLLPAPETGQQQPAIPTTGDLTVRVQSVQNKRGQLGILLFRQAVGFPDQHKQAAQAILLPISEENMQYTFADLPFGNYAVSVMHDENKNAELDVNVFGVPKEGNGVSNNVIAKWGPPKFEKAVFTFDQPAQSIDIKLRY